jgi:hypothetical protein
MSKPDTLPEPRSADEATLDSPSRCGVRADAEGQTTVAPAPRSSGNYAFLIAPQQPDEIGRLGPFRVLQVLGAGGMGVVFRAEDTELLRPVALKVIHPERAAAPESRQRFLQEARGSAAVTHDNIVTIYRVGEEGGILYLALQLLEGETLQDRLKRVGKLPVAEVVRIGSQIASGLAAAHARGLIHRDIKPANIFLEASPGRKSGDFRVKILDFGLVRMAQELVPVPTPATAVTVPAGDSRLTQEGAVLGTPAYMAPEQALGESVDARADLFSLGCVLYTLCTGDQAFPSSTGRVLPTVLDDPPALRRARPEVPADLAELVARLLAKRPDDRPESAAAVVDMLTAIDRHNAQRRPARYFPVAAALILLAIVLGGLFAAAFAAYTLLASSQADPVHRPHLGPDVEVAADAFDPLLPPTVALQLIEQRGGAVKVRATATANRNQPVTSMRLMVDGRPEPTKVWLPDGDQGEMRAEVDWTIELAEGQQYQLAVQARGRDRSAISAPLLVQLGVKAQKAQPVAAAPRASLTLLDQAGGKVRVEAIGEARDADQPVAALILLLDGRPLPDKEAQAHFDKGDQRARVEFNLTVPEGEHRLTLLARSRDASGISEPVQVKNGDAKKPALHVLGIGVGDYQDKALRLDFAAGDATEVVRTFKSKTGGLFGKMDDRLLTDRQATRGNVLDALNGLRKNARPEDLAVVYFAGHGVKDKTDFYLLTAETDILNLPKTALSGTDLREALKEYPCQVLLLLEACHAGAFGQGKPLAKKGLGPAAGELARALTDDDVGVAVMAACMGHEKALEDAKQKHGLFTLALIEGLSGKASANKRNGLVYVHQLHSYVFERVAELSADRQHPFLSLPWTVESFPLAKR